MATQSSGGDRNLNLKGTSGGEGTAKATVNDQISQAVQSTANLVHLMQQSSPSQVQLMKLPKNLLAKTLTIKNTGQVLEQMPRVISSLDSHMEIGLQSVPHLNTITQLLANMEDWQVSALSQAHLIPEKKESHEANQHSGIG